MRSLVGLLALADRWIAFGVRGLSRGFFFFFGHFLQAAHFDGLQADDGGHGGDCIDIVTA
jgi:hypothetical protein